MSKYKSIAWPEPSEGLSFVGVQELTQPDQALSLEQIMERFTRGEEVNVGMSPEYGIDEEDENNPFDIDLEKMATADLVDKAEYMERLREITVRYRKQEKADAEAKAEIAAAEKAKAEREKIRAELQAEGNSGKSA